MIVRCKVCLIIRTRSFAILYVGAFIILIKDRIRMLGLCNFNSVLVLVVKVSFGLGILFCVCYD
jgi:hypothetical protein